MTEDAKYHRVTPTIWAKPWESDTKMLALYLLTCEHRTTEGLFRLPKLYMVADLGWSLERLAQPFRELVADGFIEWDEDTSVVLIVNALRYQSPANPNGVTAALRHLALVPKSPLDGRFYAQCERFSERLHQGLPERFSHPPTSSTNSTSEPKAPSTDVDRVRIVDDEKPDDAEETFEQFWRQYPARNGKKIGKGDALIQWRKLSLEERRRAWVGARHLAESDQLPKDAHRFLRKKRGAGFPFDDWQTPATVEGDKVERVARCFECGQPSSAHDQETHDYILSQKGAA